MSADERLRVLLVCHYYPPHVGGIETVVQSEAERLVARGHDVTVLTSGTPGVVWEGNGVSVVRVASWDVLEQRFDAPFPIFSPRLLLEAARLSRWAHVVHVHDCFYLSSWSAALWAVLTRRPLVLSQHVAVVEHPSALISTVQRLVYGTIGRMLIRRARTVFVINELVGAFVAGLGAAFGKVEILSNGVDGERFRPASDEAERARLRAEYGLPVERPLVLFVGRLVPKKGFELALAARTSDFDLVVVGSGSPADAEGRPGVHYLGARTAAEVAELMRASDLLVLPSAGEVFTLVVKEAMSSGLPVVTTDEPEYEGLGVDRKGMALVPRTADSVRSSVLEVLGDSELRERMSAYSVAYAAANFSWTGHVDALEERYLAVVRGGAG
ncbi:MAG TPA: glycosyltransferase family 4 protein [Actinospica sp.]|nr:glycosyltransferase family 4 protein [Actinospica sp.]